MQRIHPRGGSGIARCREAASATIIDRDHHVIYPLADSIRVAERRWRRFALYIHAPLI